MFNNFPGMKWINSTGGPLVLMEASTAFHWLGIVGGHYDLACAVDDYLGVISVQHSPILVINQEPLFTTWRASGDSEGIIVRCVWANDLLDVGSTLNDLSSLSGWETSVSSMNFLSGKLVMFDSSEVGNRSSDFVKIEVIPGKYAVETLFYEPNFETKLLLHRIIKW